MPGLLQVLRTVSHLKLRQIAYQLIRRLGLRTKATTVPGKIALRQGATLIPPIQRRMRAEENEFTFLNVTRRFDPARFDWTAPGMDKLWRYNLHYFDYLQEAERPWENKASLVEGWIQSNPQGMPDAWEPFPVSLRIVNWIKFFLSPGANGKLNATWLKSLYGQTLWLEKNIEYHLLANHYFKNSKALVFAGHYFDGADAGRWLKKGLTLIGEEMDEQILPDGGHFERSPMYHAMILEDCLDLLNLLAGVDAAGIPALRQRLRRKVESMLVFMSAMAHPDGDISLFNDAALGIEAPPAALTDYFERLTGENVHPAADAGCSFPQTGYYVLSPRPGDRLIIDCGPVGPDYQPGHAHCDTLSFELSLSGRRVIVDSGCCRYTDSDIRQYNRGNAGHNTVTMDGKNQSEVWGAHRVARRAYPLDAALKALPDGTLRFSGAHDGYRRLSGAPVHRRTVTWAGRDIRIEDRIEGESRHDIESRLHIHPDLNVTLEGGRAVIQDGTALLATISPAGGTQIGKEAGWYCPEFGIQRPCIVLTTSNGNTVLPFCGGWNITTGNSPCTSSF
ncbi:MAG: alginate lyase family protein [Pseudomonadota bacterium]